jgi:DNA-binding beta-propeller fold protein YncE
VTIVDARTVRPIAKVDAGSIPYAFAVDPGTHTVYVANFSSNNVTVIKGSSK